MGGSTCQRRTGPSPSAPPWSSSPAASSPAPASARSTARRRAPETYPLTEQRRKGMVPRRRCISPRRTPARRRPRSRSRWPASSSQAEMARCRGFLPGERRGRNWLISPSAAWGGEEAPAPAETEGNGNVGA
jgi:hypothetical protein